VFGLADKVKLLPKDSQKRKRLYTFSAFVLLSLLFWLIIKLSQDKEAPLEREISVVNVPADLVITDMSHDKITMNIRTIGFRLFYKQLTRQPSYIDLDFSLFQETIKNEEIHYFITGVQAAINISDVIENEAEIISLKPDTLFLEVQSAKQEKVPVVFDGKIDFAHGHKLYGDIKIIPDSIIVSGPKNIVANIDKILTQYLSFEELDKPVEVQLDIIDPFPSQPLSFSETEVEIHIDVKEFTEANLTVPLQYNCPDKYEEQINNVRLFPSNATIYYLVALDDYSEVNEDIFSLKVECPFENDNNRLDIKVASKPANVEIIRIDPSRVEYILLR